MTVADDDSENENVLNVRSAGAEVDHSLWDAEKEAWRSEEHTSELQSR